MGENFPARGTIAHAQTFHLPVELNTNVIVLILRSSLFGSRLNCIPLLVPKQSENCGHNQIPVRRSETQKHITH